MPRKIRTPLRRGRGARALIALALVLPLSGRPAAAAAPAGACAKWEEEAQGDENARALAQYSHDDPCFQQSLRFDASWIRGSTGPAVPPACDNAAIWARVRQAYVVALSSDPNDAIARGAAAFLKSSRVPLAAKPLHGAYGDFDVTDPAIRLDEPRYKELWKSLDGWAVFPERLKPLVAQTQSALIHEIAHARAYEALGDAYPFAENELVAYGDQALFVRARLRRDPSYEGLDRIDAAMSAALDSMADATPWWTRPLPASDIERAKAFSPGVRRRLGASGDQTNDWFLVRSMAGGLPDFEANTRKTGTVFGESVFADHRVLAQRATKAPEHDDLPEMIACGKEAADERTRTYLKNESALVRRRRAAWYTPDSFRRQEAYYRGERDRQRRQWAATSAPVQAPK